MSEATVILTKALFGIGNANHVHMHRHNTMELLTGHLDVIKYEQLAGGVDATLLNDIASTAGGISAQPQGMVNVEDGWNQRRGIGQLTFQVSQNSVETRELVVLGYLYGGVHTAEGIDSSAVFVPQRCWTVSTQQIINPSVGLPVANGTVVESNQFLMGDPTHASKLKSMRPLDLGNEIMGMLSLQEENNHHGNYLGGAESDLTRNIAMSKTANLNPTHHARELIKLAAMGIQDGQYSTAALGVSNGLLLPSLNETSWSHNEFMLAMAGAYGTTNMSGFRGYTIAEINSVFDTFGEVYNMELMNEALYPDAENILNSSAYGSITMPEILAVELAVMTVHLLMAVGLQHLSFAANNNPHTLTSTIDNISTISFMPGKYGSVMENDLRPIVRVENFKNQLEQTFFAKYTANPYRPHATLVNVSVDAHLFGETNVTVSVNDGNPATFISATYMISRISPNIASRERGMSESMAVIENLRDHLS